MHKFLLATSAVALALTISGPASAELNRIIPAAATIAPPETTTTDGLVFSKDADQAKPMDKPMDKPAEQTAPAEQAKEPSKPAEAAKERCQARCAPRTARWRRKSANWSKPSSSSTCHTSRIAPGCCAFYKARNFAPLWLAAGKPIPRAEQARSFLRNVGGRRPRSGGLSDAALWQCRSGQACRRRTGDDQFRRHLCASRQHRPRRVHARERRGLLRPEGAQSGRRSGQARRQQGRPRDARRVQSAARRPTRRSRRSSPRSAAARMLRPRPPRPHQGRRRKSRPSRRRRRTAPRKRQRCTRKRRSAPAPTPSSPTWSAGAGCRTNSARPM